MDLCCPILRGLYLTGDRDPINPVEENLRLLRDAFAGPRADLLTVNMYPGTEHSLYYSRTGGTFEDIERDRTVPYLADFLAWLTEIEVLDPR